MAGKEKSHLCAPGTGRNWSSRNNQAHLTDKSSAEQSLSVALRASFALTSRSPIEAKQGTYLIKPKNDSHGRSNDPRVTHREKR